MNHRVDLDCFVCGYLRPHILLPDSKGADRLKCSYCGAIQPKNQSSTNFKLEPKQKTKS